MLIRLGGCTAHRLQETFAHMFVAFVVRIQHNQFWCVSDGVKFCQSYGAIDSGEDGREYTTQSWLMC